MPPDLSLIGFAACEYERRNWQMPDVHVRIYDWLERTDGARTRVLRVFRGCGKSTILGVRNAHKFRRNPLHQLLVQGADDDLAHDLSRDTISVLQQNPLCRGIIEDSAGVVQWWTKKGKRTNWRTPQFRGKGILSRVTGNRADEIQNDDVEVEKNVDSEQQRKKLRKKLSEQTHILKPDGSRLYVGTPHAHDSLYDELIKAGAEHLTIPLFQTQQRFEKGGQQFQLKGNPADVWVFVGIGAEAVLLKPNEYKVAGGVVTLKRPVSAVVDVCTGNAWPERFHRAEMQHRRKECRTLNEWDSQYQLEARPVGEVRLDPDRLVPYEEEPTFRTANGETTMWLGQAQIVGMSCRWDPSSGKLKSDVSSVAIMLQDAAGRRYWHRALALVGEVVEFGPDSKTITGGQVHQLCEFAREFHIPRIVVESNGNMGFAATCLRAALKQHNITCGVAELPAVQNKNRRILGAFEGPLNSDMLWAHVSVLDGPAYAQMRDWSPATQDQPDDYLDSAAGSITDQPERVRAVVKMPDKLRTFDATGANDWRPNAGVFEVTTTF